MSDPIHEEISIYHGTLYIDNKTGVLIFRATPGVEMLRITHLKPSLPREIKIDMVALEHLASYTPLQKQEEAPQLGPDPDDINVGLESGRNPHVESFPDDFTFSEWGFNA